MKQIWFLTGSQDLYGPETLEQVAAQSKDVVAKIAKDLGAPGKDEIYGLGYIS